MDRRRFVQLAALAGLGIVAPVGLKASQAGDSKYAGPFFIMLNASGGWDPTLFCDPKGGDVDRLYTPGQISSAGNIPYAPITGLTNGGNPFYTTAAFFKKYASRLSIVNGIDTETNNHDTGSRTTWCGKTDEGFPSFGALAAAAALERVNVPLAFMSSGGYDATGGVCTLSRIGDAGSVERLAYPNTINPQDSQDKQQFYNSSATSGRIAAAQSARLQAMRDKQTLPTPKKAMSSLFLSRGSDVGLQSLADTLAKSPLLKAENLPDLAGIDDANGLNDLTGLIQQAQLASYAFQTGIAVSANLNIGGFDTHGNHDHDHPRQLLQLLRGLAFIFDQLDKLGLSDKTYVLVGSDFGRTPTYNGDNDGSGKDHWNITSMMMAGPRVQGNRVIGSTDAGFVATNLDSNLKPNAGGVRITTTAIHVALRKLAGVTGTNNDKLFPLPGDLMPFFS